MPRSPGGQSAAVLGASPFLSFLAALLVLLAFGQMAAADTRLPPVDEAARDPSLVAFRGALLDAVRRRDIEFVLAQADPDIKLSAEGSHGHDVFRRLLTDAQGGERIWQELETAIGLGGVFRGDDEFCTPYLSCVVIDPACNCTGYDIVVMVVPDAKALLEPDDETSVVATLGYDILQIIDLYDGWALVELPDGGVGFVGRPDFRMPVDYRAQFRQRGDDWRIEAFLAGE